LSGPQQQPLAEKENIWSTFSTATRVQIPPETPSQNNPSASKETSLSLQSQNLLQSGESFRKLSGSPENTQREHSPPPLPDSGSEAQAMIDRTEDYEKEVPSDATLLRRGPYWLSGNDENKWEVG